MTDPTEIRADEFHPAARLAYRWLKGFMVTNPDDYARIKMALNIAADHGNRQAQICMGTIQRMARGDSISDRYLLGLCWTILAVLNPDQTRSDRWCSQRALGHSIRTRR